MQKTLFVLLVVSIAWPSVGCAHRRARARMVRQAAATEARLQELEYRVNAAQPATVVVPPAAPAAP